MRKITIVIPCYNASVYIDRCIKALEKQNFKDFKVIFIDDFSTDNTIDILSSFKGITTFHFQVLCYKSNCGAADSRN